MPNLFITGGGGFLARYLAEEFRAAGWRIFGLGRSLPPTPKLYDGGYQHTSLPTAGLDQHFREIQPDLIINTAGSSTIPFSFEQPAEDFAQNVTNFHHLLDQLRLSGCPARVIQLSTAAVYGQPEKFPIVEETPLRPVSPYGYHNRLAELVAAEFHHLYGMPICILRIFSAYGPGLKRQVIWELCRKARLKGELVLEGTGREERDFMHGRDVARATLLIANGGTFDASAYNIGVGVSRKLSEVAAIIGQHANLTQPPRFEGKDRPGNPSVWSTDPVRLRKLGFVPSVDLETGLKETVEWASSQL